jgi:hypothetical protein
VNRPALAFASLLVLAFAASASAAPITVDLTETSQTAIHLGFTTDTLTGVGIAGAPGATADLIFTPAGLTGGGLTIDAFDGALSFPSAFVGTYSAASLGVSGPSQFDLTASLAGTLSNQAAADLGVPGGTRYTGTIDLEFDARRRGGVEFEGGSLILSPAAVPEPSAIVLGALGLAGVGCVAWRRRRPAA